MTSTLRHSLTERNRQLHRLAHLLHRLSSVADSADAKQLKSKRAVAIVAIAMLIGILVFTFLFALEGFQNLFSSEIIWVLRRVCRF
jgi:hypothetical protein